MGDSKCDEVGVYVEWNDADPSGERVGQCAIFKLEDSKKVRLASGRFCERYAEQKCVRRTGAFSGESDMRSSIIVSIVSVLL